MDIELSLNDYWRILRKRKWTLAALFSGILGSTVIYTNLKKPMYRAQATVKYELPSSKLLQPIAGGYDPFVAMQSQLRLLNSQEMPMRAARRLHKAPEELRGSISADQVETSNMILLTTMGEDPIAVTDLNNAAVDAYMEMDLEDRSAQTRKSLEDIVRRRDEVEQALHDLEDRRKDFLAKHQSSGLGNSLAVSLMSLETQRKELLKKFTSIHPEVLKLDESIAAVKARLEQAPVQDVELERIVRDTKVNEEVFITLSKQMEETKIGLASLVPFVTVVTRPTVPSAPFFPNKRLNYMLGTVLGLFLGLVACFLLENLDISISTIEEIEKVLAVPVLGIIPHFGTENKWGMFKTHLLRRERYPMDVFRSMMVFQHRDKSPFIEVYHSLRANIQSQLPKPDNMVLTFASTGVAEGKTLTAANFCLAAAHGGMRTLLIGADLRRPVLHRIFGLPKTPGFIEVLTGKVPYQDAIRDTVDFLMGEIDLDKLLAFPGIDNFKILTGWTSSAADLVNILSSPVLPKLIQEMRLDFDLIVFDCPPVLLFVDSMLIGPHTDGVVLVYKSGKMASRALRRAKDQVLASKSNIVGVILNDMRASDMEPRYGYYYDYGHYAKKEGSE